MITQTIDMLGMRGKDKITGFVGVVTTIYFDLYGCVQVGLNPGVDKDGNLRETMVFDVARIAITRGVRVMPLPAFSAPGDLPQNHDKGPAEKPRAKH